MTGFSVCPGHQFGGSTLLTVGAAHKNEAVSHETNNGRIIE
jgi:hypothetical protein